MGDTAVAFACSCFGVPIRRDAKEYTRESRVGASLALTVDVLCNFLGGDERLNHCWARGSGEEDFRQDVREGGTWVRTVNATTK
jgi:hypothetical protein